MEWPSGEATACKAVHTGSIPVSTSKRYPARLAQRESASLTRKRSLVQSQYRAPRSTQVTVVPSRPVLHQLPTRGIRPYAPPALSGRHHAGPEPRPTARHSHHAERAVSHSPQPARIYHEEMADDKKQTAPRGPNKAEPQTKAKPAPNATPGSNKKK